MRLSSFYIDGFGIFHNVLSPDLPLGLILFQGNNETGKSTLLAFIRNILFGFPDGRSKEPVYPPLAGGQHGGRIEITLKTGQKYTIERMPGKGGGKVKVARPDGTIGVEEDLRRLMGGTTKELFKHIYAFSLGELQAFETLQADSVKDAIYGASAGTALLALPKTISNIDRHMGDLFKPGGKNPLINKKLSQLEDIRSELRQAKTEISHYDENFIKLRQIEKEVEKLNSEIISVATEKYKTDNYLKLWQDWQVFQDAETHLKTLSPVVEDFPENGLTRLENLNTIFEERNQRLSDIKLNKEELLAEMQSLSIIEALLEESDLVQSLLEGRKSYKQMLESISLNKNGHETLNEQIKNMLESLGKDWTEEKVKTIDRSLFTRNAIDKHQKTFNNLSSEMISAEALLKEKRTQHEEALEEVSHAEKSIEEFGDIPDKVDNKIVSSLQAGKDQFVSIIQDLPKANKRLSDAQEYLEQSIKDINPDWDLTAVSTFNTSLSARQKTDTYESKLNQAEQDLREAASLYKVSEANLTDAIKDKDEAVSELKKLPSLADKSQELLTKQRLSLRTLRGLFANLNNINNKISHNEERISDKQGEAERLKQLLKFTHVKFIKWAALTAGVFSTVILFILILLGQIKAGFLLGCVFGVLAVFLFLLSKKIEKGLRSEDNARLTRLEGVENEISSIKEAIEAKVHQKTELENEITQHTKVLNIEGTVDIALFDSLEMELDDQSRLFERYIHSKNEVEKANKKVQRLKEAKEQAGRTRGESEKTFEETKKGWEDYLNKLGLRLGLNPETVKVIFTKIDAIKERLKNINDLKDRIAQMEDARKKHITIMRSIPVLAGISEKSGTEQLLAIERFFEAIKHDEELRQRRDMARQRLTEKQSHAKNIEESFKKAKSFLNGVLEKEKEANHSWQSWLMHHKFDKELSPQTALDALQIIERLIQLMSEREQTTNLIHDQQSQIEEYRHLALKAFGLAEIAITDMDKLSGGLEQLEQKHNDSKENLLRKKEIEKQINKIKPQLEQIITEEKRSKDNLNALLRACNAKDEDTFRKRFRAYEERRSLLTEIAQAERSIKRISGESDIPTLKSHLSALTIDELRNKQEKLSIKEGGIREELDDLHQKKADLKHTLENMASSEDISRLRAEEEKFLEELRNASYEWCRYAIARHLIGEARNQFEKEQQPGVIKDAGEFFKKITEGRYQGIIAPIGDDTIDAITNDMNRKKINDLSRGTAEQLYLAIRFGYISNYTVSGESLPIIMDDILVNFDPIRAKQAVLAIEELAKTHQVLFFTCHPETVDIFKKHNSKLPLYMLEDGQIKTE